MNSKVKLLMAGYCTHKEKMALKTGRMETIKFPALFALIKINENDYMLFDTGYSKLFESETKKFPFNIYAMITPVFYEEEDSVSSQLSKLGISKDQIKFVFISHFHADHISGLKDFPNAKYICSKRAYQSIQNSRGFKALLKAYIPNLLPNDFTSRCLFIEDTKIFSNEHRNSTLMNLSDSFGPIYDILGDGSLLSMDLSGHAEGQFGLFINDNNGYVFLVADAVWRSDSFKKDIKPFFLAKIIMSNSKEYIINFNKIVAFHKLEPSVFIVPSHCEEVFLERM